MSTKEYNNVVMGYKNTSTVYRIIRLNLVFIKARPSLRT